MSRPNRAVRSALVVIAGALGIAGTSSSAVAQRIGYAADPPPPPPPTVPYPGATVTIDPRWYNLQQVPTGQMRRHQRTPFGVPPVIYYPVPSPYSYYAPPVRDATGRPLYLGPEPGAEAPAPDAYPSARNPNWYPSATPDLSGSPYVVLGDGAMQVEFGYGDTRVVPSCAVSERDPNGRPRTIFYTPPTDSPILRPGSRGRVQGTPSTGVRACYGVDVYGRMELRY